jgi:hypothetical protein
MRRAMRCQFLPPATERRGSRGVADPQGTLTAQVGKSPSTRDRSAKPWTGSAASKLTNQTNAPYSARQPQLATSKTNQLSRLRGSEPPRSETSVRNANQCGSSCACSRTPRPGPFLYIGHVSRRWARRHEDSSSAGSSPVVCAPEPLQASAAVDEPAILPVRLAAVSVSPRRLPIRGLWLPGRHTRQRFVTRL